MQNPFNHENYPSNDLKRNAFPCSFQTNLTMKYGYIYPAGIWRTVPGATYKIQPTLGLNFMPTTFPVQTRQKVYVHYFYGRDRNFWKDYKDFVNGQCPDLVKPYIDESVTKARTGKLLDYLGVPTTLVGAYGNALLEATSIFVDKYVGSSSGSSYAYNSDNSWCTQSDFTNGSWTREFFLPTQSDNINIPSTVDGAKSYPSLTSLSSKTSNGNAFLSLFELAEPVHSGGMIRVNLSTSYSTSPLPYLSWLDYMNTNSTSTGDYAPSSLPAPYEYYTLALYNSNGQYVGLVSPSKEYQQSYLTYSINYDDIKYAMIILCNGVSSIVNDEVIIKPIVGDTYDPYLSPSSAGSPLNEVVDIDDTNSPYWRSGATTDLRERIKLNAFLPRMYETIYNLYYRNPQNNPYMLNGVPEYNKFIPTKDGGVDSNLYELRRRNWEDDFLTTAVQSPQQGIAPLVGLTDRGATLTLTNEDGSVTRYNVSVADNGSLTGIEATDTTAEPVLTKALIDAVSYGISIEDIRNVNAMQKWLELNLRKGYQYKDIIQARWGISISYNELDLPEFIGGFSRDVQLQAVTQTANVNDDVTGQLGWQAGRLFASGEGREITHYCDEEGYIMCLVTTVPVPNYSQLLPKHWIERDLLDSYQPEFNHIGFQPITYKEVCPVQAYQESTENVNVLEQTFGYQRPWYQYFNYTDEVHGQFRTTFKDFLINRVFDVKPELSESFLLVDPEQINDVFNVTDPDDDKIIGAIYHNCVAKLPISLYAQARLE